MQSILRQPIVMMAVVFSIIPLTFAGCPRSDSLAPTNSKSETNQTLPASAMRFHKPKELKDAVGRMKQLHDAMISNASLPQPIEYQVKEVIHGTGASGHSHYYLHEPEASPASGNDENTLFDYSDATGHDDHDHETTGEKIHDVTIDPFVELKDLAKWLPKIASDSSMGESEWTQVNATSKQLTPMLNTIIQQSADNEKRRGLYREQATKFSGHLVTLEELIR